jgi:hypothetical protein
MGDSPAAELRQAADHARAHHGIDHPRYHFWRGVATWFDRQAEDLDHGTVKNWARFNEALDTARAYLGGSGD